MHKVKTLYGKACLVGARLKVIDGLVILALGAMPFGDDKLIGIDVRGDDMAVKADLAGHPAGDRADAAGDIESPAARTQAAVKEHLPGPRAINHIE
jgi:hypothetical protein